MNVGLKQEMRKKYVYYLTGGLDTSGFVSFLNSELTIKLNITLSHPSDIDLIV